MHVIALGDMEAYPSVLQKAGYKFLFTDLEKALLDIYQR
jgi:NAD dependent epimerase/dehydratase family enzyme